MQYPINYVSDLQSYIGRVLEHDDNIDAQIKYSLVNKKTSNVNTRNDFSDLIYFSTMNCNSTNCSTTHCNAGCGE